MKIMLNIDRLVLDGLPVTAAQGARLQRAMEQELSRLFAEGGVAAEFLSGGAVPRIDGAALRLRKGEQTDALGKRIAQSVYAGIGSPARITPKRPSADMRPDKAETVPTPSRRQAVRQTRQSRGIPLDSSTRAFMEARFARDFGAVRVHTDSQADRSSRAMGADAFTHGSDIMFRSGGYAPETPQGRALLAHELTHVVQSVGAPDQPVQTIASPHSSAEREASRIATQITLGLPIGPIRARAPRNAIHRTVAGDVGGGAIGGLIGGAIGAGLGGVGGAIAGGLLGGLAGVILGEVATTHPRPLTDEEALEVQLVFGSSLDLKRTRIAESSLMAIGDYARTPFETAYFPIGAFKSADFLPWLVHELTHVWQTQHGISVFRKIATALRGASAYEYGGPQQLVIDRGKGKKFLDYGTEQQADICRDYYRRLKASQDVSAYLPFIAEVKRGGKS